MADYANAAIKFKDNDGNSGTVYGLSTNDVNTLNTAVALTKTNQADIAALKAALPGLEAALPGLDDGEPIDLTKVAKVDAANTFTAANTFSQNVTMSVDQADYSAIEDQHLVTGKALKQVAAMASASSVKFVESKPETGSMDAGTFYFYPAEDSLTSD